MIEQKKIEMKKYLNTVLVIKPILKLCFVILIFSSCQKEIYLMTEIEKTTVVNKKFDAQLSQKKTKLKNYT